jgi:hypothetical protein
MGTGISYPGIKLQKCKLTHQNWKIFPSTEAPLVQQMCCSMHVELCEPTEGDWHQLPEKAQFLCFMFYVFVTMGGYDDRVGDGPLKRKPK